MLHLPEMGSGLAAALLQRATRIRREKDQAIVEPGWPPDGIHFIESGLAGFYARVGGAYTLVAPAFPGIAFETCQDRELPVTHGVRALSVTFLQHVPERHCRELLEDPAFRTWCSANQLRNHSIAMRLCAATNQRHADHKIMAFVEAYLEMRLGRSPGETEQAEWLFTQTHVSELLGLTRTHFNARLAAFAETGHLEIERRRITYRRHGFNSASLAKPEVYPGRHELA